MSQFIERLGSRPQRKLRTYDEADPNEPRLKTALDGAEAALARPGEQQYRARGEAVRTVHAALRNLLGELASDIRRGYKPRPTAALVREYAGHLPESAQREVRAFVDESSGVLMGGEQGSVHEGARRLATELGASMAEQGWQLERSHGQGESPDELAAQVPR